MNKHDRVRAAVTGQPVDHVPSGFWLHFPKEQAFGKAAIDAHVDFFRATDVDLYKVMNEATYPVIAPIRSPADWATWKPISVKDPYWQKQLDVVKGVCDRLGGEAPILATIHGTFISTFHGSKRLTDTNIKGPSLVTDHLRTSPEAVVPAMAAVTETLIELAKACLQAGANGIYYGAQGAEAHRFDERTFVEYVKPWDLRFLRELEKDTDLLVVHVCKDHIRLPLYADYPGHVFNWSVHESDYPLETGRALLGRTILGGIDTQAGAMIDGSKEAIRSDVASIIGRFGKQAFLLGGDCTLPTDISHWRIRAAVEAARDL